MNQLKNLINQFTQFGAKKGGSPNVSAGKGLPLGNGSGSRPMKFPYTFTAKLVQFPWMYYIKNNWLYKNYVIAIVVSLLAFVKIQNIGKY